MRILTLVLALACGAAAAAAQEPGLRAQQRLFGGATGDRALIQACMREEGRSCETLIQDTCHAEAEARGEDLTGVFARACDERAITAWEEEMNAALAVLRAKLAGRDRRDLERSQQTWREWVLMDVQLAIDSFQGGTGAGLAADQVQARETARRAVFLNGLNESFP